MKTAVYFSLICWIVAISYILFELEETRWEVRAIRAGVGQYNEFKNFEFKSEKQIILEFIGKELNSKPKVGIKPSSELKL